MIVQVRDTADFNSRIEDLKKQLFEAGHLLIRGLFSADELSAVRKKFTSVYETLMPRGTTRVLPSEIVNKDLLKFSAGQFSGAQIMARLFLILYRQEENLSDVERTIFDRLIQIYEIIQGKRYSPEQLAANDSFYAKRYQYYPSGGGFIGTHADTFNVDTAKRLGGEFIQFVLPITLKGEDYMEGGGYVIIDGQLIANEDNSELGDLIIYDGSVEHGVADIDPFKPLTINGHDGRIVMLTTLYKKLKN